MRYYYGHIVPMPLVAFLPAAICFLVLSHHAASCQDNPPDSIRQRCDSILIRELGAGVFYRQVSLHDYRGVPLGREGRQDYALTYVFTFPGTEGATLELPFVSSAYEGQVHVQSGYFMRTDSSDLPPGFIEKGLHVVGPDVAIDSACAADPFLAVNRHRLEAHLVLTPGALVWSVGLYQMIANPEGDAEEAVYRGVRIDPYAGKVIEG